MTLITNLGSYKGSIHSPAKTQWPANFGTKTMSSGGRGTAFIAVSTPDGNDNDDNNLDFFSTSIHRDRGEYVWGFVIDTR